MTRFLRRMALLIVTPLLRCEDWMREWVGYSSRNDSEDEAP
jgi:hypothetical protein